MSTLRRLFHRLRDFFWPDRAETELAREVASHLGLLEDEFRRRGMDAEEAREAAVRAFAGLDQAKDAQRDARSFVGLEEGRRDLKLALRTLRRSPGFTCAVVLILAMGVGANTALFSVIDGVVLKPLDYPDAERIVAVENRWTDSGDLTANVAGGDLMDMQARSDTFEAFAYYQTPGDMGVRVAARAEMVRGARVHPHFFRVFGVDPTAGRLLLPDDAEVSAVVSPGFAERLFGSVPSAVGRSLTIGSKLHEIVGVVPDTMRFPADTEVWAAAPLEPANRNRSGHNYRTVARLAGGVSVDGANADLATLATRLAREFPDTNGKKAFVVRPLAETMVGAIGTTLFLMMGAVALVLLIACANVANLILARASGRSRELAVRAALGAGRRHIVAQLLAESLVLAAAAGAVGLLIARVATDTLLRVGARYVPLPRLEEVHIDFRVLLFTAAVSLLTAVFFGVLPALQASRLDVSASLGQGGSRSVLGPGSKRLRGALVVAQIALSFTLAVDAALLLRSFIALTEAPLGFRTDGVLVAYANAPAQGPIFDKSGLDDHLREGQRYDELFARLREVPGVTSAAGAMGLPTGAYDSGGSYAVEGQHVFGGDFRRLPYAGFRLASPGYFRTMGIPVRRGREFGEGDTYDRPFVAVVSESLARKSFGDGDPIGHRIMCGLDSPEWMTIVGVVGDVRQYSPASSPAPELYMPLRQHPSPATRLQVVVRTRVAPESLTGAVRNAMQATSPDVAVRFTTLKDSVDKSIAAPRFRMVLASVFAGLALLLAVGGMYALMSYGTSQRTTEFGLRMALGAQARDVVGHVVAGAARLVALGLALGLLLAFATSRVISAMLFGIRPLDTAAYLGVVLLSVPLIFLAAVVPALRAARVDPTVALREP